MRIDHRTGTVRFGTDLAEAQRQDLPEGPHVQSMPSEQIRNFSYIRTKKLDRRGGPRGGYSMLCGFCTDYRWRLLDKNDLLG